MRIIKFDKMLSHINSFIDESKFHHMKNNRLTQSIIHKQCKICGKRVFGFIKSNGKLDFTPIDNNKKKFRYINGILLCSKCNKRYWKLTTPILSIVYVNHHFIDNNETTIRLWDEDLDEYVNQYINLERLKLAKKFNFKCVYCKSSVTHYRLKFLKTLIPMTIINGKELPFTRDHLNPKSNNGKNGSYNITFACKHCNDFKDSMIPLYLK